MQELEESLAQSMYQEEMLRGELQEALEKIAELANDHPLHQEIISERYQQLLYIWDCINREVHDKSHDTWIYYLWNFMLKINYLF